MKVLIITYYWPPSGGSGVQRWLKFSKYLPEFGVEPVIFTVDDPNYAMTDDSLAAEISKKLTVIKGKIWEPNRIMNWMGKGSDKASAGFLDANPDLKARFIRYVRANFFIPDARKYWIKPSVKVLSDYLSKNEVDFVISTGPPHSTHLIALELKERFGLKWIADFRDPWTGIDYFHNLPLTGGSKRKHRALEEKVLKSANQVIVVGETMKKEFSKITSRVKVISNGYDGSLKSENIVLDEKFSIVYVGLMNSDRNPIVLWEVLGEMIKQDAGFCKYLSIKIIGTCSVEVLNSLEKNGLSQHVESKGYLDHQEVSAFQRSAQILLLTVNNVPSARGIVTGKIFEYLQARRPILAIGPTDGDLAEIIHETNAGFIHDFNDVEGMRKAVEDYYKLYNKNLLTATSQGIEKYHRKQLTKELFEMMKEI